MKFKKDDVVERVDGDWSSVKQGEIYTVKCSSQSGFSVYLKDDNCEYHSSGFKLADSNPMPELKAGMIFEFTWRYGSTTEHLSLGEENTIMINSTNGDRSQPLRDYGSSCGKITKIYSVENMQSWDDYNGSKFGTKTLIWQATPPETEQQRNLNKLEKIIEDAAKQIKEIKDGI